MCTTPVLALLDFTKTLVLECDASRRGIGSILMQDGRHLDFTRKNLLERHLGQSIYENKMLSILHAVALFHHYILGQHFQIKTDHQKWVTKLFGYDYETIYKKVKDNVVVDSLSIKYEDEVLIFSLSFIVQDGSKLSVRNAYMIPKFLI
jgi:hypothetical protein